MFRSDRVLAVVLGLVLLAACSGPPPVPAPAATSEVAAAAPVAAAPTDEAGLRAAAATALSEQRIYAPAGDNTLEYYLALRTQRPDDGALATALLELLPYALIGSEQAMARGDFAEARRLLGLIERADPQAPALVRLRDGIVAAEAQAAQRLIAEAEAEKLRLQQEQRVSEQRAVAAEPDRSAATPPAPPPPASAPAPVSAPPPATAAPVAATPAAAPAPRPSTAVPAPSRIPRLLSAPNPRYPMMALRRKLEGDVTVEFTIQPDGSVASPRVVAATPAGTFEEAALVATRRWRFEAGAGPVKTSRVVQFRLAEGG